MSELSHSNSLYSSLSESSPALSRQGGAHAPFTLDHGSVMPPQDQYHDIRPTSPYSLAQSPASLQPLPRQQPLISSLVYPDSSLPMVGQGGHGMVPSGSNGPSSELSTGSSGGYPEFPASPASWLDEVEHSQFWWGTGTEMTWVWLLTKTIASFRGGMERKSNSSALLSSAWIEE